ncbi:hypothetical protein [Elizabethkingia ursingii]
MSKILYDISKKEKFSAKLMYFSIGASLIFSLIVFIYFVFETKSIANKAKDEVYIMVDNIAYKAVRSKDYGKAQEASMKGTITLFNDYFWNLEPYPDYINERQKKAFDLSDESSKRLMKSLNQNSFYTDIINTKSSTIINVSPKEIQIDFSKKPYTFTYSGEFLVKKASSSIIHKIKASGELEEKTITDNNFTGWMIRNYKLENLERVKEENTESKEPEDAK